MWEAGTEVARLKYNVVADSLYRWRDKCIANGSLEPPTHVTCREKKDNEKEEKRQMATLANIERSEAENSPEEYIRQSLRVRMNVLRTMNKLLIRTQSLRDVNDCLRVLNEGLNATSSNLLPGSGGGKITSIWDTTKELLKYERELLEIQNREDKPLDITHEIVEDNEEH